MNGKCLGIRDNNPRQQWTQQDNDNPHKNRSLNLVSNSGPPKYEGWNFNSGNYLFTTDTK